MKRVLPDRRQYRVAWLCAQRDAFKRERDQLASAIDAHRARHPDAVHEADRELWGTYSQVVGPGRPEG